MFTTLNARWKFFHATDSIPIEGPLKNVNPPYPKIVLLLNQTENKKERKKERNRIAFKWASSEGWRGCFQKGIKEKKQSWGCWRKKADSAITERYFFVSDLKVYARLIHLNVMFLNERVSSLKTATFNAQLCLLIMNREENCFKFLMKEMHEAGNEQKNWIFKSPKWNNPILFFIPGKCRQDFTAEIWYFCFFLFVSDDHLSFTLCSEPGWQRRSHGLPERFSDVSHERTRTWNVTRTWRTSVTITSLWRRQ